MQLATAFSTLSGHLHAPPHALRVQPALPTVLKIKLYYESMMR